jgi:hypothetical protein
MVAAKATAGPAINPDKATAILVPRRIEALLRDKLSGQDRAAQLTAA